MVFSSHLFLFYFLPLALGSYYALYRAPQRWRNVVLIISGYAFYGWAEPAFMFLMFATTFIDWLASLVIAHDEWRLWRTWKSPVLQLVPGSNRSALQISAIILSITVNICVLGFFKYFNFGLQSYNSLLASLGWGSWQWNTFFEVILPLGISFYTFQAISYTVDVYRGEAKAMSDPVNFACFVSMFPHLVAGPILKFSFLAKQIEGRTLTIDKFARGIAFFSLGFCKKILLANPCGKIADLTFLTGSPHPLDAWYGVVAYAFQIYFDFSGYSDMAIGLGLMLGFIFTKNFDSPYHATSITDFWRRWHISLSSWLRNYLYIPLGGNRIGGLRTYINLMVVMLIGGLWHGASWNFVIWGAIHGCLLALERAGGGKMSFAWLPHFLRVAVTFGIVAIAWVFFRAKDLDSAIAYCRSMAGFGVPSPGAGLIDAVILRPYYLGSFLIATCITWLAPQTWDWTRRLTLGKAALIMLLFWVAVLVMTSQSYNPFIYFNF